MWHTSLAQPDPSAQVQEGLASRLSSPKIFAAPIRLQKELKNAFITEAVVAAAGDLGYSSLKEEQLKVVNAFLEGPHVFAVLPTGYGKSLCFPLHLTDWTAWEVQCLHPLSWLSLRWQPLWRTRYGFYIEYHHLHNEKHWSANLAHACIRCQIATLWYICRLVALNTTKYVIMTDVTARLNLEESHQF